MDTRAVSASCHDGHHRSRLVPGVPQGGAMAILHPPTTAVPSAQPEGRGAHGVGREVCTVCHVDRTDHNAPCAVMNSSSRRSIRATGQRRRRVRPPGPIDEPFWRWCVENGNPVSSSWPAGHPSCRDVAPPRRQATRGLVVECRLHGDMAFLQRARTQAQDFALFVTDSIVGVGTRRFLLRGVSSSTCEGIPTARRLCKPCADCHAEAGEDWGRSIHAANVATAEMPPTAWTARVPPGFAHRPPLDDVRLNVAETCARCHADPAITGEYFATRRRPSRDAATLYYGQCMGRRSPNPPLVSATCNDAMVPGILPADSSASL
jgi:hypothetical protein